MTKWDYIVIAVYVALMLGVGVFYSRRARSTEDYMLGGRQMAPWKVGISLFSGTFSTISYLMVPGEIIQHGPGFAWSLLAIPLEAAVICLWIIPSFMKTRITSAYELLESRLGLPGRIGGAIMFLGPKVIWMALILFLTSRKVLVPALGWPEWTAPLICVAIGLVTVTYASLGGIRAVVLTDVIQAFILFAGALVTIAIITIRMNGFDWFPREWSPTWDHQPFFSLDPYVRVTTVGVIVYHMTSQVLAAGSDQLTIQRSLVTRNTGQARKMYLMSTAAGLLAGVVLPLVGLALLGFFQAHPELLTGGVTVRQNGDKIFPFFIMHLLPAGMTGLLLSALLAAAMGSVSSGITAVCSVVTKDFVDRFRTEPLSDAGRIRQSKWLAVAIGASALALSLVMGRIPGNIVEVCAKCLGLFSGALFTMFFMSLFVSWATPVGTIWAASYAMLSAVTIAFWDVFTGHPSLSFTLIMPVSTLVGLGSGVVLSWLTRQGARERRRLVPHLIGAAPVAALVGLVLSCRV